MSDAKLQYLNVDGKDEYQDVVDSEFFDVHMHAMTAENLHKKSEIAVELARRDIRISDLERRNGELEKLLAVAACPQCDDSGAVYGPDRAVCCNRPTESGECCNNPIPEQTMEPCQFCEERHALTRTKEQSNG